MNYSRMRTGSVQFHYLVKTNVAKFLLRVLDKDEIIAVHGTGSETLDLLAERGTMQ